MQIEILKARVNDLEEACHKSGAPRFLGFLSAEQAVFVQNNKSGKLQYCFFGGYEGAERVFLSVAEKGTDIKENAYPISSVTFTFRPSDNLTHRDVLGSLMSKGIKREAIGDILVERGRAVVFVTRDILKYVLEQISRIGKTGVTASRGFTAPLPSFENKVQTRTTVASSRLDCVVAALINLSRGKSNELIEAGLVSVNSVVCSKNTKTIMSGDKITIRGYGKFTVISLDGTTKKGRTIINIERYK